MRRSQAILLSVAVVALLGAAFWWLDFHAAQSETRTNSQVTTMSSSAGTEDPNWPKQRLAVYVDAEDGLGATLAQGLKEELGQGPNFTKVTVLDQPTDKADSPLLVVTVAKNDGLWTPVYARTRMEVKVEYASLGDVRPLHQSPVGFTSGQPSLLVDGHFEVQDNTRGIVSRQAYASMLGNYLAQQIAPSLERAISQ
ncbi:MAG: hypothetical protein M0Z94_07400 [Dehalococcoidales bacterium]|nr:hypothetical protein [Dehalococcoidales bacterium]